MMTIFQKISLIILLSIGLSSCVEKEEKILIFSKTAGFRHTSIEVGIDAITQQAESIGIRVDTSENAAYFTQDSLKNYAAVIFLNTTGDVLNHIQQAEFERYIQAGGGFLGIHAATDTEYDWPWYNQLVGAYFNGHPKIQDATLKILNPNDPCCQHLGESWQMNDEWYNFKSINPAIEVLVEIDETSYEGGTNGEKHPMVWRHNFDGGRSFYSAMGHRDEIYADSLFMKQIFSGLDFVMGENKLDYSKAITPRVPEENRFKKKVLDFNLDEPMELDELGDRGILYIERRGAMKLYNYQSEQIEILDSVDVFYANEDGLLGVAVDQKYSENHWIYIFYSPNIDEPTQYVSRFTLKENKLEDEKVLLKIPVIRECCHSGGSLEFGKDGLLYIGVGDNTNPFESAGYAPIDERPDRQLWDAQRSASNTNDLRGKILRIKPETDGTYSIPEGNLFPEGKEKCRPEMYVMGCRNPFRFSIDSKSNFVYWGDVGPDAGKNDSLRGPFGMGEFNQAKVAGYYGWPYSRGNNQMYGDFNFTSNKTGARFDPSNIINDSPNNTGIEKLPPIQESLIWFSYGDSKEFPWLGAGGVNPMSGPIYNANDYKQDENSFPTYFENKWFVYEWMRDWVYVVHLDEDQQYIQADPFMPGTEFSHPMDMLFAKNGQLYVLEYGQKWNSRNLDARLSVISYIPGNRPPVANFSADKEAGAAPLAVQFSAANTIDYDNDELTYTWSIDGKKIGNKNDLLDHTFSDPGIYDVELRVSDPSGESISTNKKILVGNEAPKIQIELSDRNTTYWKNKKMDYKIFVTDLEDGKTSDQSLDPTKVKVTLNYIPEGEDMILASMGHQQNAIPKGLELINASDCKACHGVDVKVAGPSYQEIAERYESKDKAGIIARIIKGSQGIWGETMMAAHPQLKVDDVDEMVDYILSLDPNKESNEQLMTLEGSITFTEHLEDAEAGKYVLMASYLDEGHPAVEGSQLSTVEQVIFRAPKIEMENAVDLDKEMSPWETQGRTVVGSIKHGKHIKFHPLSFENLSSISIAAAFNKDYPYYGEVEVRQGQVDGKLLGKGVIEYYHEKKDGFKMFQINLENSQAVDSLFLVFNNPTDQNQFTMNGDWIQLNYNE